MDWCCFSASFCVANPHTRGPGPHGPLPTALHPGTAPLQAEFSSLAAHGYP